MKKTYIITKTVDSPMVISSQTAHKPAQVKMKRFRKGQIVQGELKHAENQPAFVLVGRMCVIPLECVKELEGKEIVSKFSGSDMDEKKEQEKKAEPITVSNPKVQYLDAILMGGAIGFVGTHYAIKKGWLQTEDSKARIYGAVLGAVLGAYLVFRSQAQKATLKTNTQKK
jgi:hypothetical protein